MYWHPTPPKQVVGPSLEDGICECDANATLLWIYKIQKGTNRVDVNKNTFKDQYGMKEGLDGLGNKF